MSGLALILIAGDKHSRTNAEKIRAWLTGDGSHHRQHIEALVADWRDRNFLTKEDAAALVGRA